MALTVGLGLDKSTIPRLEVVAEVELNEDEDADEDEDEELELELDSESESVSEESCVFPPVPVEER